MAYVPIASLVVSVLALIGVYYAIQSAHYTKTQVDLLKADSDEKKLWAAKHAQAVALVLKTNRYVRHNNHPLTHVYSVVLPDAELRTLIETYIVERDWAQHRMVPRVLDADQFALPVVQEVIQKTIDTVEEYKRKNHTMAAMWGLL